MGYLNTILTAVFCATAPIAEAPTEIQTEVSEPTMKLGKETVKQVRSSYKKGEYKDFLSQMDNSYKSADISSFIKVREKNVPIEFQEKWETEFLQLQQLKSKDLLAAVSDKDDSVFAEKVRSSAATISTPEQEKAISKLNSLISKAPNTGVNQDENTLIAIDLEYEYKLTQASTADQQLALRMEKMDKMSLASKSFQDSDLKQAVGLAAANLDARLARNIDGVDLNTLVRSKAQATNETQEQVYQVISSYQGQFADLMKALDHANR